MTNEELCEFAWNERVKHKNEASATKDPIMIAYHQKCSEYFRLIADRLTRLREILSAVNDCMDGEPEEMEES